MYITLRMRGPSIYWYMIWYDDTYTAWIISKRSMYWFWWRRRRFNRTRRNVVSCSDAWVRWRTGESTTGDDTVIGIRSSSSRRCVIIAIRRWDKAQSVTHQTKHKLISTKIRLTTQTDTQLTTLIQETILVLSLFISPGIFAHKNITLGLSDLV